ncbi:MAG: alpha/beta hydrolase [Gammaproteobacteria bacterium]|nr:alpha/beta hydrolase [Gammaproteobacteria bacterium]
MIFRLGLLCLFLNLSIGCFRLDANLYNNDNSIDAYRWDAYDGHVDFVLDSSYDIPAPEFNYFTLESNNAGDRKTIHALYLGDMANITTDTVILYCHGNRDHMDFYWPRAKLLANGGYGILMFDYRGYGLSEGEPSESGLYADTRAAIQWLADNGVSNNQLIFYGFSMGSAPCTKYAAEPFLLTPSKLILEAPFASAEVMVQDGTLLAIPGSYVTNLKINNVENIKKVTQPLMWIHGYEDIDLALKTHGEVVFKNHGGSSRKALRVTAGTHNNLPEKIGFLNYLNQISDFVINY